MWVIRQAKARLLFQTAGLTEFAAGGCGAQARTVRSEPPTFTATSGCERLASMRFRRRQLLAFACLQVYFVN